MGSCLHVRPRASVWNFEAGRRMRRSLLLSVLFLCIACVVFYKLYGSLGTAPNVRGRTRINMRSQLDMDQSSPVWIRNDPDICHLFSDGSLKVAKPLIANNEEDQHKDVLLAKLNGQTVVIKTASKHMSFPDVRELFKRKSMTVDGLWIREETIDALLWPAVETVHGFSSDRFESIKRMSDRQRDHLFDVNEMKTLLNAVAAVVNTKPSQEVWYHTRLPRASFLPKYFGRCNSSHVVEYLTNGDIKHFVQEKLEDKRVDVTLYKTWKNIVVGLIHLIHQLEETDIGAIFFCDAQAQNFGIDINWEVKLLDVDNLFTKKSIDRSTNQSCNHKEHQCGLHHCHSDCNIETRRCNQVRRDYNYWALCEMVFRSGRLIKDRNELEIHQTQGKFLQLQQLVIDCSQSRDDVTGVIHQIEALLEDT